MCGDNLGASMDQWNSAAETLSIFVDYFFADGSTEFRYLLFYFQIFKCKNKKYIKKYKNKNKIKIK
jgi:hypothetical protein